MGEKIDHMKGAAKEKTGQLKDDPDLEAEGKRDQAKGDLKEGVDNAAEKVKRGVDKVAPWGGGWGRPARPPPTRLGGHGFAAPLLG
jgi:uncharacterized protein YjbJ (UPF0337 family)